MTAPPETSRSGLDAGDGIRRHVFWLPSGDAAVPAWLHRPAASGSVEGAVVICPPLGFEYAHSYRSLIHLADALARRGLAVLRFDYHGTGAAPGDAFEEGLLERWIENTRDAMALLARSAGVERCSLVGVQLGALVGGLVASRHPVESLVLWAPVAQGRRFVRERLLLADVADDEGGGEGHLDAGGFVLSAETARHVSSCDLTKLEYRVRSGVLIVEREDVPNPASLGAALEGLDIDVDVLGPGGYAGMMAEPQYTVVPTAAIEGIADWLASRPTEQPSTAFDAAAIPSATAYGPADGVTEELVTIGSKPPMFGVLTRAAGEEDRPLVLLSNAGAVHQVGPNRTYVELTRSLAAAGFPSLRLDLRNLGDSITRGAAQENHPYADSVVYDVSVALQWLSGHGFDRVVLGGLCSGAHAAFRVCLTTERDPPIGLLMVNPLTFRWTRGMTLDTPDSYRTAKDARYYRTAMRNPDSWKRLLKGDSNLTRLAAFLGRRTHDVARQRLRSSLRRVHVEPPTRLHRDLQRLKDAGIAIDCVFSEADPGRDILRREAGRLIRKLQRSNDLNLVIVRDADHTFSKLEPRGEFVEAATRLLAERYAAPGDVGLRAKEPRARRHEATPS